MLAHPFSLVLFTASHVPSALLLPPLGDHLLNVVSTLGQLVAEVCGTLCFTFIWCLLRVGL